MPRSPCGYRCWEARSRATSRASSTGSSTTTTNSARPGSAPQVLTPRQGSSRAHLRDVEQLLPNGVEHGLHAGVQLQLLQDVPDVVLHGVLGDEQVAGDLAVVATAGDQAEYVEFALGQARGRHAVAAAGLLLDQRGELVEELGRHGGTDQRLAVVHRT